MTAARDIPLREVSGLPFGPLPHGSRPDGPRHGSSRLPEDNRLTDMKNLPLTPPTSLSHEIADAAGELACRIELGEFDDLDEEQMAELRTLATLMAHWAAHAQAMEHHLFSDQSATPQLRPPGIAQCN